MNTAFHEIEQLFAPIANAVSEFAAKYALDLEKCPRGNSGWELSRDHPEGGKVFLLMLYDRTRGLGVGSVWHFPCEAMSLNHSHFRTMRPCAIESDAVIAMLDEELEGILVVKFGYWTHLQPLQQSPLA